MKSGDLLAIDTAALQRPWSWCDGTLLWNKAEDHCVLSHGGTRWPISPENHAAIESAMNHMPALISLVADVEHLKDALDRTVDVPKMSQAIHSVIKSLARVHEVPPPSPNSPVAWDPDSGHPLSSTRSCWRGAPPSEDDVRTYQWWWNRSDTTAPHVLRLDVQDGKVVHADGDGDLVDTALWGNEWCPCVPPIME